MTSHREIGQTIKPAFGTTSDVGQYLGAGSPTTARRWISELRAKGLPVYQIGGRTIYKFQDVERILEMDAQGGKYA